MHVPVMIGEVVDLLAIKKGGVYVDGTLGGGGHAKAILEAAGENGFLIGIDQDEQAVARVRGILDKCKGRSCLKVGNFSSLGDVVVEAGVSGVDGILLDLGFSSWQMDDAGRGFSFMKEGPLDMRMSRQNSRTAGDIINEASQEELLRILREYGEEPMAWRIVGSIVAARQGKAIRTTTELAKIIERAAGKKGSRIHPATLTFQALRIAVNDELGNLERGLDSGLRILAKGGRFAVISFHSLEDRIVKRTFLRHVGRWESLAAGGSRFIVEEPVVSRVTRKPVIAAEAETKANPRARSAKLRVVERVA